MIANLYTGSQNYPSLMSLFNSEMNFLMEAVKKIEDISQSIFCENKICVAVSGGSDSVALLIMVVNFARAKNIDVVCVTVDHKLRNESTEEGRFVARLCDSLGIEHQILTWHDGKKILDTSLGKLENAAREARYSLIRDFCMSRKISIVLLGHTLDDQLETFCLRESSGSSEVGLACMSRVRRLYARSDLHSCDVFLIRPLMQFRKNDLKKILIDSSVEWKNDPMNDDISFRRVRYRKEIENYDDEKVFAFSNKIRELGIARRKMETKSVDFLTNKICCQFSEYGYVDISFSEFAKQQEEVQCNILRRIIWDIGGKLYSPNISSDILQKVFSKTINTLGGCLIRISKNIIKIMKENRNLDEPKIIYGSGSCVFNNFLVKITNIKNEFSYNLIKYVVSCSYDMSDRLDLSKEMSFALPCVCFENKVVFAYGAERESYSAVCKIECEFLHRKDLFDIFL